MHTDPAPAVRRVEYFVLLLLCTCVACPGLYGFEAPGPNLAVGRPYTLSIEPSYPLCKDAGDAIQLTDGVYVPGCTYRDKDTVGWKMGEGSEMRTVLITIDLGRVEPIAGVSYSTLAGGAEVPWPNAIVILVSDDGEAFHPVGELTALSALHERLPFRGPHRYRTNRLSAFGRYVRLAVMRAKYIFCDEIEVYRGRESSLTPPRRTSPVADIDDFIVKHGTTWGVRERILLDILNIEQRAEESKLPSEAKADSLAELSRLRHAADEIEIRDAQRFRCIVPLHPIHTKVFAVNAQVLRGAGQSDLAVWHCCRWDRLTPLDAPRGEKPSLSVRMMRGEYRAEVLNLTNTTGRDLSVRLAFEDLPGSPGPGWIEPHEVAFIDSAIRGQYLATLLLPMSSAQVWRDLVVPAGMTKQVWFRFHPVGVPPGDYAGSILVVTGEGHQRVPLQLHVSKLRFPEKVRCGTATFDYTDRGSYDFKRRGDRFLAAAVKNMQEHFVNQTWAHGDVAAIPGPDAYNAAHELTHPLDWTRFDTWVERWGRTPSTYAVYLNFSRTKRFAGESLGTQAFNARVSAWASAWRRHVVEIGLDPRQIAALIFDEYKTDEQAARLLKWCRPIKAGYPDIKIFETLKQRRPDLSAVQELNGLIDIFCPHLPLYYSGGPEAAAFYARQISRGAQLWIYRNHPIDLAGPYWGYRLRQWRCWANGMTGTGFWAYCDSGRGACWNPYTSPTPRWSPVFIGDDGIHDTKHWEAFREGLEDYEYLAMLRDQIADAETHGRSRALIAKAKQLLREAPERVLPPDTHQQEEWWADGQRIAADMEIAKILDVLEGLLLAHPH